VRHVLELAREELGEGEWNTDSMGKNLLVKEAIVRHGFR
jgi:hypothetical protein